MSLFRKLWLSPSRRREIAENIDDLSTPRRSYFVLTILSTAIAALGLLANSTAVVIGGMLVAPLMGPIYGVGFGLIGGQRKILIKGLWAEVAGVATVVGVAFCVGWATPAISLTNEILARTQPTILDVGVALASGLVGAFALVNHKISAALPGVAIAVALVPPLAVTGLMLAASEPQLAAGAFLLFLANFVAIELAAALTFSVYGLATKRESFSVKAFFSQFGWSAIALAVIGAYLYQALVTTIEVERTELAIRETLAAEAGRIVPGARIDSLSVNQRSGMLEVTAVMLTPKRLDHGLVSRLQEEIKERIDKDIRLIVRSIISSDSDARGQVFVTAQDLRERSALVTREELFAKVTETLTASLQEAGQFPLADVTISNGPTGLLVEAVTRAPDAVTPDIVDEAQRNLRFELGVPVELRLTTLIVAITTDTRILTDPEFKQVSQAGRAILREVEAVLASRVAAAPYFGRITSLDLTESDGVDTARISIESSTPIPRSMVEQARADLLAFRGIDVELVVTTSLVSRAEGTTPQTAQPPDAPQVVPQAGQ